MGKIKVGVEPNLNNVKRYLEDKDINVKELSSKKGGSHWAMNRLDAVVLSGTDINLMGMQDIIGNARVIDATGMTPEEVYNEIIRIEK